jgi:hypothetical protein
MKTILDSSPNAIPDSLSDVTTAELKQVEGGSPLIPLVFFAAFALGYCSGQRDGAAASYAK